MHLRHAAVAVTTLLLLTGCGHTARELKAINALRLGFIQHNDAAAVAAAGPRYGECAAEGLVDRVGLDQLEVEGVLSADQRLGAATGRILSSEVRRAVGEAGYECLDWDALAGYLTHVGTSPKETEVFVECLKDIDQDVWKGALADELQGAEQSWAREHRDSAISSCVPVA